MLLAKETMHELHPSKDMIRMWYRTQLMAVHDKLMQEPHSSNHEIRRFITMNLCHIGAA